MIRDYQVEPAIFSAPLLPGRKSLIQQYYKLSRWLTLPLIVLAMVLLVMLYGHISTTWLVILVIILPVNFVIIHFVAARLLASADRKRWHEHKLCIGEDTLTIFSTDPKGKLKVETFDWSNLEEVKWVFSGYERAFLPQSPNFNGAKNELTAKYRSRALHFTFRLVSPTHYRKFFGLLEKWYAEKRVFDEYTRTSGLPVQSYLLEVDHIKG